MNLSEHIERENAWNLMETDRNKTVVILTGLFYRWQRTLSKTLDQTKASRRRDTKWSNPPVFLHVHHISLGIVAFLSTWNSLWNKAARHLTFTLSFKVKFNVKHRINFWTVALCNIYFCWLNINSAFCHHQRRLIYNKALLAKSNLFLFNYKMTLQMQW